MGVTRHPLEENPDRTREALLRAAYAEIHRHGFQAASLSRILRRTGLTKGALYHHFKNKHALGLAVIDEVIAPLVEAQWIDPLKASGDDPIGAIQQCLYDAARGYDGDDVRLGCPLNNLAQEMSPIDEEFRLHLEAVFQHWRDSLAEVLAQGAREGRVAADIVPDATAVFLVAALEGCVGMAKNAGDPDLLRRCGRGVLDYLERLRPKPFRTSRDDSGAS